MEPEQKKERDPRNIKKKPRLGRKRKQYTIAGDLRTVKTANHAPTGGKNTRRGTTAPQ